MSVDMGLSELEKGIDEAIGKLPNSAFLRQVKALIEVVKAYDVKYNSLKDAGDKLYELTADCSMCRNTEKGYQLWQALKHPTWVTIPSSCTHGDAKYLGNLRVVWCPNCGAIGEHGQSEPIRLAPIATPSLNTSWMKPKAQ